MWLHDTDRIMRYVIMNIEVGTWLSYIKHWGVDFQSFCFWMLWNNVVLPWFYENEIIFHTCLTFKTCSTGLGGPKGITKTFQLKILIEVKFFLLVMRVLPSIVLFDSSWCDPMQSLLQLADYIFALLRQLNQSGANILRRTLLDTFYICIT